MFAGDRRALKHQRWQGWQTGPPRWHRERAGASASRTLPEGTAIGSPAPLTSGLLSRGLPSSKDGPQIRPTTGRSRLSASPGSPISLRGGPRAATLSLCFARCRFEKGCTRLRLPRPTAPEGHFDLFIYLLYIYIFIFHISISISPSRSACFICLQGNRRIQTGGRLICCRICPTPKADFFFFFLPACCGQLWGCVTMWTRGRDSSQASLPRETSSPFLNDRCRPIIYAMPRQTRDLSH